MNAPACELVVTVIIRCFRNQLLLLRPYLVLTKPLSHDIRRQRCVSVKIGCKYLDNWSLSSLRQYLITEAPFFSPNGEWIGFRDPVENMLKKVAVLGGPPVTICEVGRLRGANWGTDDTIVFAAASGDLVQVPAAGGEPAPVTNASGGANIDYRWPHVLPGGGAVLFTEWNGSPEESRLAVIPLDTRKPRFLLTGGSHARYSPTGHLVYAVSGTLRAIGFDLGRLEATGDSVLILEDLLTKPNGTANFTVADNGTLLYVTGASDVNLSTLVFVDREGQEVPAPGLPSALYWDVRVSPDSTQVAVSMGIPSDILTYDIGRGTTNLVTTDSSNDRWPLWTPDGQHIVFQSDRGGRVGLYRKRADGTGVAEPVFVPDDSSTTTLTPSGWLPDGKGLLIVGQRDSADIATLSLDGGNAPDWLMETGANETRGVVSPSGDWLAYQSDVLALPEIWVERFPMLGERQRVSRNTAGGRSPVWSADGRELFYFASEGRLLHSVSISEGRGLTLGEPRVLFSGSYSATQDSQAFDVMADNEHFAVLRSDVPASTAGSEMIAVLNWTTELAERVPTDQ